MLKIIIFAISLMTLTKCLPFSKSRALTPKEMDQGETLRIYALENPRFLYKNLEGKNSGLFNDLIQDLGSTLEWRISPEAMANSNGLLSKLTETQSLIVSDLSEDQALKMNLVYTQPIIESNLLLVCSDKHDVTKKIPNTSVKKSVKRSFKKLLTFVSHSKSENLPKLKSETDSKKQLTKIVVSPESFEAHEVESGTLRGRFDVQTQNLAARDLLIKVWKNPDLCTLIDEKLYSVFHIEIPELEIVERLESKKYYRILGNKTEEKIVTSLNQQLIELENSKKLQKIVNLYFGRFKNFDYADYQIFLQRLEEELPRFLPLFKKIGREVGLPWTFLAAVAYQESHWDPKAISPTGVKGFMMLTKVAANEVGVKNIESLEDSLLGGAKYLKKLMNVLPQFINDDDREIFALAAYNGGMGLIQRARVKAIVEGKNPNKWEDVVEILPRLSDAGSNINRDAAGVLIMKNTIKMPVAPDNEFKSLPNPALVSRPQEAIRFVQKVRFYEVFLKQREKATQKSESLFSPDDEPEN